MFVFVLCNGLSMGFKWLMLHIYMYIYIITYMYDDEMGLQWDCNYSIMGLRIIFRVISLLQSDYNGITMA